MLKKQAVAKANEHKAGPNVKKTRRAQNQKNKTGPNVKKKQEAAKAERTTPGPHNEGRPSAAPHHTPAATFGGRRRVVIHYVVQELFARPWPLLVFLTFGPILFFWLWPRLVFLAWAPAPACFFSTWPQLILLASGLS